ncbi:Crp/Fnr family transcriptional regulator [Rhizobium sp. NPDC090275]|uniref:Crp/Fnr family transcriptional regulator n=1 Tax=Rhizobium sp. NPDC090275 TaxID=3364498 RepID=UPI003839EB6A
MQEQTASHVLLSAEQRETRCILYVSVRKNFFSRNALYPVIMLLYRNRLLSVLSSDVRRSLQPFLKRRSFHRGEKIEQPPHMIHSALFVEEGVISVIFPLSPAVNVEVGMIGREGMTGISLLTDASPARFVAEARTDGWALEILPDALKALVRQDEELAFRLARYDAWRNVQSAMIAASGRAGNIEQNLARELLMLHDRIDGDRIVATHDELGSYINVRRASVTEWLHVFEGEHWIRSKRGYVEIVDRPGLEAAAGDFYGAAENAWFDMLAKLPPDAMAAQ